MSLRLNFRLSTRPGASFAGPLLAASVVAGAATEGHAAALTAGEILGQFNAVVAGDFTSSADVEGRLVANHLAGGAIFYIPRGTAAASGFAAVNAVTVGAGVTNANVNNGGDVDVQGANLGHFNLNGGRITGTPAFAIGDFTAPLGALSARLAGLASNSAVGADDPNRFTFNVSPDAGGTAVFNLTAGALSAARNLIFAGTAATIVVNVSGAGYAGSANFNAGEYLNRHVIWNFFEATSLSFQGWHGTVLAPLATVTNSSPMEGSLFAQNFHGGGELHDFTFAGTLPALPASTPALPASTNVPEPALLPLFLGALLGLGAIRRKRA